VKIEATCFSEAPACLNYTALRTRKLCSSKVHLNLCLITHHADETSRLNFIKILAVGHELLDRNFQTGEICRSKISNCVENWPKITGVIVREELPHADSS
jgi:hypothetical protein